MALTPAQEREVTIAAKSINVEPAKLLAFVDVEAGAQVYTQVGGRSMPLIRWEGHYFLDLLPQAKKKRGVDAGLAGKRGAVKNPAAQAKRYDMLERGKAIDVTAAISSTSYGIGQVMGIHWRDFGFASAEEFERVAFSGFAGQLSLMVRFLEVNDVVPALRRGDWSAVARVYNGPAYKENAYDTKLSKAYKVRLAGKKAAPVASSGMVRAGSKGPVVREVQTLLVRAGFATTVDGDFGPGTTAAIKRFQSANGLETDGVAGPQTLTALRSFKAAGEGDVGTVPVYSEPEVQRGGVIATGGVLLETAKEQVDNISTQVVGVPGLETIGNVVTVVSAVLVVAGIAYAGYQWYKSRKSELGTA